jgi:hypothetical protein
MTTLTLLNQYKHDHTRTSIYHLHFYPFLVTLLLNYLGTHTFTVTSKYHTDKLTLIGNICLIWFYQHSQYSNASRHARAHTESNSLITLLIILIYWGWLFINTQICSTIIRNGNISSNLFFVHIVTLVKLTWIEANFLLDVNHLIYYCTSYLYISNYIIY